MEDPDPLVLLDCSLCESLDYGLEDDDGIRDVIIECSVISLRLEELGEVIEGVGVGEGVGGLEILVICGLAIDDGVLEGGGVGDGVEVLVELVDGEGGGKGDGVGEDGDVEGVEGAVSFGE